MSDYLPFSFLCGILKPFPKSWDNFRKQKTSALQRIGRHKLLDLNVLKIIGDYHGQKFLFTSHKTRKVVKIIFNKDIKTPGCLCELSDGSFAVLDEIRNNVYLIKNSVCLKKIKLQCVSNKICTNSKDQIIIQYMHWNIYLSKRWNIFKKYWN